MLEGMESLGYVNRVCKRVFYGNGGKASLKYLNIWKFDLSILS